MAIVGKRKAERLAREVVRGLENPHGHVHGIAPASKGEAIA
jgi:hypothetical protein